MANHPEDNASLPFVETTDEQGAVRGEGEPTPDSFATPSPTAADGGKRMAGRGGEAGGAEIIELDSLDTSFAINPAEEGVVRRRLMTLIAVPIGDLGHIGANELFRARNTAGEVFAVKRLRPRPADADPFARRGREAAFFEEYRNQLAVSHLRGFPSVYGYGIQHGGDPVIIMEWIDGTTLLEALPELPADAPATGAPGSTPQVTAATVAAVGVSALSTLAATAHLEGLFAHRDISLRNIMIPEGDGSIADRVGNGTLETRIIDLGSSVFLRREDASFTMSTDIWRNATPEYAAPEMLAPHATGSIDERYSPAIDIYALSSVLYRLYAGRAPFPPLRDRGDAPAIGTTYERKLSGDYDPLEARSAADEGLVQAILSGLAPAQEDRPTAAAMLDRITRWQREQGLSVHASTPESFTPASKVELHGAHLSSGMIRPDPLAVGTGAARTSGAVAAPASGRGAEDAEGASTSGQSRVGAPGTRGYAEGPASSGGTDAAGSSSGRATTRRTAVKVALAAAGTAVLAGIGAGAWLTRGFGLLAPRAFSHYSWDGLSSMAAKIADAESEREALAIARRHGLLTDDGKLRDDLVKPFTLADGTEVAAQVVGIYHDDLSDAGASASGRAGLTLAFTEPAGTRPMSETTMASGGWEQCDLRAWLADELMGRLPDDLASAIRTVRKRTNNIGAAKTQAAVTETDDALWLFSIAELGGDRKPESFGSGYTYLAEVLNAEGSQYRLWEQQGATAISANEGLVRRADGNPIYWWNRSPSPDVTDESGQVYFNRVGENGDPFHFAEVATDGTGSVLPGFCL